jgi:Eukaryotic elongation factor 5A hypusine, DNA-binding OB fold
MPLNSHPLKVNIDDGFLNLMSPDGASKDDVRLPEGEIGTSITSAFEEGKDLLVTIISAMNEEQVSFPRADWLECARLLAFRPFRSKRPPRAPSPHSLTRRLFLVFPSVFLVFP